MKKLLILLLFSVAAQAQTMALNPFATAETVPKGASVNKEAIGLDLMGGAAEGITVFPNQNNDHLIVSVAGRDPGGKSVFLSNASGQTVLRLTHRTENTFMLDVSGLRSGLYFLEVRTGAKIFRKKWVK